MRQLDEDTRTIARDGIASATAPMVEVDTDFKRPLHNAVGLAALHVYDQTDTAIFVFVAWVIKTLCFWRCFHFK